jgi:hypothetical protein
MGRRLTEFDGKVMDEPANGKQRTEGTDQQPATSNQGRNDGPAGRLNGIKCV